MRGECMVGHMCTYSRILGAEPLRAPQPVLQHATLSPTITFHSNAAAQSAAHEAPKSGAAAAPSALSAVPKSGCADSLGGFGEGQFARAAHVHLQRGAPSALQCHVLPFRFQCKRRARSWQ